MDFFSRNLLLRSFQNLCNLEVESLKSCFLFVSGFKSAFLLVRLVYEFVEVWDCAVGGESVAENCQILQTRVNRFKSNKEQVDTKQLKGYSCDVKFTGNVLYSLLPLCIRWDVLL